MWPSKPTHEHYKGGLYTVYSKTVTIESTMEEAVLYKNVYGKIWVRPVSSFNEVLPSGRLRFTPIK